MTNTAKIGVLLINTGSTAAPRTKETRAYLREFLSDPRMIDIPAPLRWLLLNCVILPFRPKRSAEAYAKVWREDGSPLIAYSQALCAGLQQRMPDAAIELAMRYGKPSIEEAMERLIAQGLQRIVVAPMFPQYTSAATGSALEAVYGWAGKQWNVPALSVLPPFWDTEGFVRAWAAVAKPHLDEFAPDHVLFSYHGLPERHIRKSDPSDKHCLRREGCCQRPGPCRAWCYRTQCYGTTERIAASLGLDTAQCGVSFQSRLGRTPWLTPATDLVVPALPRKGIKRLAVLCPAFTADCLETLEEIGIRAKADFLKAGGEAFRLVPCLNDHPVWVDELAAMLSRL